MDTAMDWLTVVSLTVGVVSIALAVVAIVVSLWLSNTTTRVLAEIDKRAAVIDEVVRGTQTKLVDTLTTIASPPRATQEEMLYGMLGPLLANNPHLMETLVELGNQTPPSGQTSPQTP